jgi:hypothetical protein
MVFKLAKSAERHWRRLDGSERLAQVIPGVRFRDGEPTHNAEEKVPPDPSTKLAHSPAIPRKAFSPALVSAPAGENRTVSWRQPPNAAL